MDRCLLNGGNLLMTSCSFQNETASPPGTMSDLKGLVSPSDSVQSNLPSASYNYINSIIGSGVIGNSRSQMMVKLSANKGIHSKFKNVRMSKNVRSYHSNRSSRESAQPIIARDPSAELVYPSSVCSKPNF